MDDPLLVPDADGRDCDVVEEEGLTEPEAEPPAAPMPDAEPLAVPEADGPELQAARAAEHARARISLFIRISFIETRRDGCRDEEPTDCLAGDLGRSSMLRRSG
ncbi:hypothetical protein ACPWT1_06780 [Ramlibacter sp. MMS24-I3-19]|uniref:hypothetical protein n=1 Tax=Ramlibacter sp. MMS24-I3-19 TaxID=3416606 RepID=UPI003D022F84